VVPLDSSALVTVGTPLGLLHTTFLHSDIQEFPRVLFILMLGYTALDYVVNLLRILVIVLFNTRRVAWVTVVVAGNSAIFLHPLSKAYGIVCCLFTRRTCVHTISILKKNPAVMAGLWITLTLL